MTKELSGIQIGNWIVKYAYFIFMNFISTSWMHLYQIDLSSNREFQNISIFLLSSVYDTIHKFLNKMFKSFVDSFCSWCIIVSLT